MHFTWETAHLLKLFSLFTVMRPICWQAFAPNTGIKSSATTVNRTAYLFSLAGFTILTLHSPSGVFNDLSHICSTFVDGASSATWRAGIRFTDAPQSSWSFTSSRPMRILAKSSLFVGVSSRWTLWIDVTPLTMSSSESDCSTLISCTRLFHVLHQTAK